jgi:hypothetical protein
VVNQLCGGNICRHLRVILGYSTVNTRTHMTVGLALTTTAFILISSLSECHCQPASTHRSAAQSDADWTHHPASQTGNALSLGALLSSQAHIVRRCGLLCTESVLAACLVNSRCNCCSPRGTSSVSRNL